MNRYASIDIGTNTILMVVADLHDDGTLTPVYEGQKLPRLGKGVDANRAITQDSIDRVIEVLHSFKHKAYELHASKIFACGTSALRDARNCEEVLQIIKQKTDMHVEIISGEKEAEYTYYGALSGVPQTNEPVGILDIGGGSTELVVGKAGSMVSRSSIDIGCVRLTEQYFPVLPPAHSNIVAATNHINNFIREQSQNYKIDKLIGVAGTVTTLAAIVKQLEHFSPESIDNFTLSKETIDSLFSKFSGYSLEEMKRIPQIISGREDILLAGIIILKAYLSFLQQNSIIVSSRGLRYGQILAKKA